VCALAVLVVLWACNEHKLATPPGTPSGTVQTFIDQTLTNDVDVLFMVDDSSSMTPIQSNLVANFPRFINVLKSLPAGLPNVHIAVTTSSLGAGAFSSSVEGCANSNGGRFVYQPRVSTDPRCVTTDRITGSQHFIESLNNGALNNFSGDIAVVFGCIAQVGDTGCGFEHQLAAVRAALGEPGGQPPPPAGNEGFLREHAYLAVIWITNEDDCSAPPSSQLFDPNNNALGPLASYRCTEYGILCGGQSPPRNPAGPFLGCTSNEAAARDDPLHSLLPVQSFIDYLGQIKPPGRVIGAAVAGPTEPFSVALDELNRPCLADSCGPRGTNVCSSPSQPGTYGDPAVRLKQVIDSLGNQGKFITICQDSYADAMQDIARLIGNKLGPPCLEGRLAQAPDFTHEIAHPAAGMVVDPSQLLCTVEDVQYPGTPRQKQLGVLPPCQPGGQPLGSCWAVFGDPTCAQSGVRIAVCRNGFDPSHPDQICPQGPVSPPDGDVAVVRCVSIP